MAVQADVVYAIALGAKQDRHDSDWRNKKTVAKPAHQVNDFIKLRAAVVNLVMPIWNTTCNSKTDIIFSVTCYNSVKHKLPVSYPTHGEWLQHTQACYNHKNPGQQRRK